MKRTQLKVAALAVTCFGALSVNAQEAAVGAGGDASGSGGSSSYSVGQVVYTTPTGTNGSMAQGVQQPYEISATTGIDVTDVKLSLLAYPNPTKGNLNLSVGKLLGKNLSYQLINNVGKLVQEGKITTEKVSINMEELPKAIYFIRVNENQELLKTFKIIKN